MTTTSHASILLPQEPFMHLPWSFMQGHSWSSAPCHRPVQGTIKRKYIVNACMAAQILCTSGGLCMAEENLAAVQSALMDLLGRGGAFAGLFHVCACRLARWVQGV